MTKPRIWLDISKHLTVVLCSGCPQWRESASNAAAGHAVAQRHAAAIHGDDTLAASFRGRRVVT